MKDKTLMILFILVGLILFKNPISVGLMHIVDFIGYVLNINVVDIIDFLNTIYYL